jgi:hypothetical protein
VHIFFKIVAGIAGRSGVPHEGIRRHPAQAFPISRIGEQIELGSYLKFALSTEPISTVVRLIKNALGEFNGVRTRR